MSEALFWMIVGPCAIIGALFIIGNLFGNSGSGDFDCGDPQCSPSRRVHTARRSTPGRDYQIPERTSYQSQKYRWHGLERSVREREHAKRQ